VWAGAYTGGWWLAMFTHPLSGASGEPSPCRASQAEKPKSTQHDALRFAPVRTYPVMSASVAQLNSASGTHGARRRHSAAGLHRCSSICGGGVTAGAQGPPAVTSGPGRGHGVRGTAAMGASAGVVPLLQARTHQHSAPRLAPARTEDPARSVMVTAASGCAARRLLSRFVLRHMTYTCETRPR
jgi:hypothetical protein